MTPKLNNAIKAIATRTSPCLKNFNPSTLGLKNKNTTV